MNESKGHWALFIVYLIGFHAIWTGWVVWCYPWVHRLGEASFAYAIAGIAVRIVIWVLPVFLYLRHIDHEDPIDYLKLKQFWKRGVLIGLALTVLNALGTMLRLGLPHPSLRSVTWNSILGTSLLIGFVEEVPYRGFILQKLCERFPFAVAVLISSLLFVGVHLPGWITLGLFSAETAANVFGFGVVMALVFRYSKSLWSVIVAHSLNDWLSFVIFRN